MGFLKISTDKPHYDSFIDYWIINKLTCNEDCGYIFDDPIVKEGIVLRFVSENFRKNRKKSPRKFFQNIQRFNLNPLGPTGILLIPTYNLVETYDTKTSRTSCAFSYL